MLIKDKIITHAMSSWERLHGHGIGRRWRGALDPMSILERAGLEPGKSLLDLGSGDGRFSLPAVSIASRVHAVDISEEAIRSLREEASRRGLSSITASVADVSGDLEFNEEFDIVLLANVLHGFVHSGSADVVLENARRALKPGGRLLVVEFRPDVGSPPGPPSSMRISPGELSTLASRHGFDMVDRFEAGPFHYAAVFRKIV
ncbi:MAG TPA: class I SAM-dependent methyltransferase [Nitrososphaeria archaeon]|jgi:ubiquinone/menaquinone biosynthesis C-methylase UbiE|nr:class I SAM-dependent methyltransferase [Nitrososphaeria archaeon]